MSNLHTSQNPQKHMGETPSIPLTGEPGVKDYNPTPHQGTFDPTKSSETEKQPGVKESVSQTADAVKDKAKETTDTMKQKASDATDAVIKKAGQAKDAVSEKAAEIGKSTKESYEKGAAAVAEKYEATTTHIAESFKDHPLLFTAGAVAAGFLVGLSLPQSRRERRALGTPAHAVREKGEELYERTKESVRAGADSAKEAFRERNLDPESLKESADYVGSEAVEAAKDSFDRSRH